MLQTEYPFTLPLGYVDAEGNLHKDGVMRLATAFDEIAPLKDPRVQSNPGYLLVILLSRVITRLGAMERIIVRVARAFNLSEVAADLNIARNVHALYGRHRRIALAVVVHLAAWIMGAVQVWAAAQAMDRPLSPEAALALESLVYAARGALFIVPWGAGVQEGGFVLVGAVLGLDAAGAIALSLVLRARDALLGTPAVLLWYAAEGRERWLKRSLF